MKRGKYNTPYSRAASFRMGRTPYDPRTGKHLKFWPDDAPLQELTIVSECTEGENIYDCLVCEALDGKTVYAAKPFMLQSTPFDGLEIDGVTYAYTTPFERTADDGETAVITELVTPPYIFGRIEKIIAGRVDQSTMDVGARRVEWVDLNTSGRNWDQQAPVPSGGIIEFEGFGADIQAGWTLCDGRDDSKGIATPNLSGKFIVGYSSGDADYDEIGKMGGFKLHGPTENEHTEVCRLFTTNDTYVSYGPTADCDNRPPYYTLAFIRKD